jgi:hypothetical protein
LALSKMSAISPVKAALSFWVAAGVINSEKCCFGFQAILPLNLGVGGARPLPCQRGISPSGSSGRLSSTGSPSWSRGCTSMV